MVTVEIWLVLHALPVVPIFAEGFDNTSRNLQLELGTHLGSSSSVLRNPSFLKPFEKLMFPQGLSVLNTTTEEEDAKLAAYSLKRQTQQGVFNAGDKIISSFKNASFSGFERHSFQHVIKLNKAFLLHAIVTSRKSLGSFAKTDYVRCPMPSKATITAIRRLFGLLTGPHYLLQYLTFVMFDCSPFFITNTSSVLRSRDDKDFKTSLYGEIQSCLPSSSSRICYLSAED